MTQYHAHSANGVGRWHPLAEHLATVSRLAACFAATAPWREEAALAGFLHDLGKYGDRFQARLRGKDSGLDHWSQGAWLAVSEYRSIAAALAIQGHHIGLQTLASDALRAMQLARLTQQHPLHLALSDADLPRLKQRLADDGLSPAQPAGTVLGNSAASHVGSMLDVRMLFSCLTDADFLDTEAHMAGDEGGKHYRASGPELRPAQALEHLLSHLERLRAHSRAAPAVAGVRESLLEHCLGAAALPAGLYTLTAPTGSGKTLAMLAFALAHAARHGLRRVVSVIPFLSIIEQTARIYRDLFQPLFGPEYVLEHHSLAGLGAQPEAEAGDAEGSRGEAASFERRRRLLAENWDAPLIVTTSVQMLESLFSNRPSACRKLHRLAGSVILFDEVQTLPAALAVPTLAALSHLAHAHGTTVLFATATQPAFDHLDGAVRSQGANGWKPAPIVTEPQRLFTPLRRHRIEWRQPDHPIDWDTLARELEDEAQVLYVLNLKRHAEALFARLSGPDTFHLSTNLCPAHRHAVLETVRARLREGAPVRLVATQCVEAGVDLDFPVVYRAYGPLEAILQAAGRCNREGRMPEPGAVRVFAPVLEGNEREFPDHAYAQAAQITRMLLQRHGAQGMAVDDPDFITGYYRELYKLGRPECSRKAEDLARAVQEGRFPDVARLYRLIEQDAINVVVPYGACISEFEALRREAGETGLSAAWLRRARPLTVGVYRPKPEDPLWDHLIPVQRQVRGCFETSEDWFIAASAQHYDERLGYRPPRGLHVWIG